MRNPVDAAKPDSRRLGPDGGEGRPHGPDDQMLLPRPGQVSALAVDLNGNPGFTDPRVHLVVQGQRQPERVEARTEVSAGRGDLYPHRVVRPGHLTPYLRVLPAGTMKHRAGGEVWWH